MAARILDVCDALVAAITAAWNPVAPDAVEREYVSPIKAGELSGRRVWVFPLRYSDSPASRTENLTDYGVAVVVTERYGGDESPPPKTWTDELVTFVEEVVYSALDFGGDHPVLMVGDHKGLWTESADVAVYTPADLSKNVFWSELAFTFNEVN